MEESNSIPICSHCADLLKEDLKSSELVSKFNVLLWSTDFLVTLLNHLQIISDLISVSVPLNVHINLKRSLKKAVLLM